MLVAIFLGMGFVRVVGDDGRGMREGLYLVLKIDLPRGLPLRLRVGQRLGEGIC